MGCCGSHSFALLRQGRRVGKIPSCSRTAPQHPISHIRRREEARRSRPLKAAGLASPEPPVATVLQVPTPAPGAAWKLGARERGASRSPALCVPNPGTPRCRLGRALRSPPGGRHVAEPGARARPDPLALTVAPRLVLQVGACQGCRRPGRAGARGSAERAYDPQVASHPEQASERRAQATAERQQLLPAAWRPTARRWARGARARPGRGFQGRHPIGPRREGAGPSPAGPSPARRAPQHARGGKPGWTSARGGETHPAARAGAGAGGLGEPLARLNPSLQDSPLKPGCQLLTHQPKPQKACEPSALSALLNEGGGYLRLLKFSLRSSSPLLRCCRLTGIPPSVSHQKIKLLVAEVIQHSHGLFTPIPKENCNSRPAGGPG